MAAVISVPPIYMPIMTQDGQMTRPWVTWFNQVYAAIALQGRSGAFTANGATPVTIANANYTDSSIVLISLNTAAGVVGALPHIDSATPGTGFDIVADVGDISIYNYLII